MTTGIRSLLPTNQSLTGSFLRAGVWAVAGSLFTRVSGIIRVMMLGRLLQPDDFGVAALATTVYVWLEQLGQTGLEKTLIRMPGDIRPYLYTAWTINMARAVVGAALMLVSATWVAGFLNTPELGNMLRLVALTFIVKALESPAFVYVKRNLNARAEVRIVAGSTLAGLLLLLPLAVYLRNAWAMVIAALFAQVMQTVLTYFVQPFRPRLEFNRGLASEMFGFSRWLMWSNIAMFPQRYLTSLMVGKVLGTRAVGFYQVAMQLAFSPTSQIGLALGALALPAFAKVEGNKALRQSFLRVLSGLGTVVIPAACFVSAFAPLIIRVTMGGTWMPAAPVAQLLTWAGVAAVAADITSQISIRQGHPKLVAFVNISGAAVLLAGFYPALKMWGNVGIAGTLLAAFLVGSAGHAACVRSLLDLRFADLVRSQRIPAAAAAPFVVSGVLIGAFHPSLGAQAMMGAMAAVCCMVVLFVFRGEIRSVLAPAAT